MVTLTPKTVVTMKLRGRSVGHTRTDVAVRDLTIAIDEPKDRGGTNAGATPTETLLAALAACINVIAHRIADKIGLTIDALSVDITAQFDRRGVLLEEALAVPFVSVEAAIHLTTAADDTLVARLKSDVTRFCPISTMIRQAGTKLTETWHVTRP
jgi:putative redox protein